MKLASIATTSLMLFALVGGACKKQEPVAAEPPPAPAPTPPPAEPAKPATPPDTAPAAAPTPAEPPAAKAPSAPAALLDPSKLTEKAPAKFKVKFTTTKGDFVLEIHKDWAPIGVDRFYNLVKAGFFDDARFFRVIKGFMVQWGIHGDPAVNTAWHEAHLTDDPVKESNKRGYISFATAGPNTRTTQVFINFKDNTQLDGMGFAPFGKVTTGMNVVDSLYADYGEGGPGGGPMQPRMQSEGNEYLKRDFPKLDYIKQAKIVR